jgi:hypothetical protein
MVLVLENTSHRVLLLLLMTLMEVHAMRREDRLKRYAVWIQGWETEEVFTTGSTPGAGQV